MLSKMGRLAALLMVALAPALAIGPGRHAGFVADDFRFLTEAAPASLGAWVGSDWGHSPGDPARYRPIVTLSYAVDRLRAGDDAGVMRTTNLAAHGLAAVMLTLLAVRLAASWPVGLAAGALFAVHPAVHENVVWISGRTYPLAAVFMLAALAWLAWTGGSAVTRHGVGIVLALLAVGSYEAAVSLPLAVFWLHLCGVPDRGSAHLPSVLRGAIVAALPYAGLILLVLLFRRVVLESSEASALDAPWPLVVDNLRSLASRLATCDAISPWAAGSRLARLTCLLTGGLLVISVAALATRQRRLFVFGAGLALIAYLPFVMFPGYTDRFAYLSLAGAAMMIAALAGAIARAPRTRDGRIDFALAASVLLVLVVAVTWGWSLRRMAGEWVDAGAIAKAITDQARASVPDPPAGAVLRFFRVPLSDGRAYVYITSFTEAVHRAYGRTDLDVQFDRDARPGAAERAAAASPATFVFDWDATARALTRVEAR